jgi:hypothetical protein
MVWCSIDGETPYNAEKGNICIARVGEERRVL